jgi:hypothetical protein
MYASDNGHHDIVRTLLEAGVNVNAQSNVRNQLMMMMMMILMIVINDEDRDVCRLC